MTDLEFDFLRAFLKRRSGLALGAEKRYLVESRLAPVCDAFRLGSLHELAEALKRAGDGRLERAVVEAMTTNETFFFRDRAPFDLFRDHLLPQAMARRAATRRLRIWCAAASSGQEPYSLAMLLREARARLAGWTVDVVATDLSHAVLEKARGGLYSHFEVQRGLPVQLLVSYFQRVGDRWRIDPALARTIDFRPLNLLEPFGHLGRFDIVFCRNVLIYFDAATKADILRRIAETLNPDGAVVLGAAESVVGLTDALVPDGEHRAAFRRPPIAAAASPRPVAALPGLAVGA